jgi:hypothetical protein
VKPADMKEYFPLFPEGSELMMLQAPPGLEEIVKPAPCVLMPDGSYTFVYEFETHEEWKEFQKNRKLLVISMGVPAPLAIGAFHVGKTEGEENSLLELQSEAARQKN